MSGDKFNGNRDISMSGLGATLNIASEIPSRDEKLIVDRGQVRIATANASLEEVDKEFFIQ